MATTRFIVVILLSMAAPGFCWLFGGSGSGRRSSRTDLPRDINSGSGLRSLYNTRVVHAERVQRPLGSGSSARYPLSHSGVRLTDANGKKWLVHKGDEFGRSSSTVVTSADHMSSRWRPMGRGHDVHRSTVGDFVGAGGRGYDILTDNCHGASGRMMRLP